MLENKLGTTDSTELARKIAVITMKVIICLRQKI